MAETNDNQNREPGEEPQVAAGDAQPESGGEKAAAGPPPAAQGIGLFDSETGPGEPGGPGRRPPWRAVAVTVAALVAGAIAVVALASAGGPREATTPTPAVEIAAEAVDEDTGAFAQARAEAERAEREQARAEREAAEAERQANLIVLPPADIERRPQRRAAQLDPPLNRVLDDLGSARFSDCHAKVVWTYSPPCVFGKRESDFHVVVFGDSHIAHWGRVFERAMATRNWRLTWLTKSTCTPAITRTYNPGVGRENPECDIWRRRALDRIAKEKPDVVFVGGTVGAIPAKDGVWRPVESVPKAREIMVDSMARTLRQLKKGADHVVVMADIPAPRRAGILPVRCIRANRTRLDRCAFPADVDTNLPAHSRVQFDQRAAAKVKDVQVLNMVDYICPDDLCRAVIDGKVVFRDDTHLSGVYTRSLARVFNRALPASWVGEGGKAPSGAPDGSG